MTQLIPQPTAIATLIVAGYAVRAIHAGLPQASGTWTAAGAGVAAAVALGVALTWALARVIPSFSYDSALALGARLRTAGLPAERVLTRPAFPLASLAVPEPIVCAGWGALSHRCPQVFIWPGHARCYTHDGTALGEVPTQRRWILPIVCACLLLLTGDAALLGLAAHIGGAPGCLLATAALSARVARLAHPRFAALAGRTPLDLPKASSLETLEAQLDT